jgi:hypothetical protein
MTTSQQHHNSITTASQQHHNSITQHHLRHTGLTGDCKHGTLLRILLMHESTLLFLFVPLRVLSQAIQKSPKPKEGCLRAAATGPEQDRPAAIGSQPSRVGLVRSP